MPLSRPRPSWCAAAFRIPAAVVFQERPNGTTGIFKQAKSFEAVKGRRRAFGARAAIIPGNRNTAAKVADSLYGV